MNDKNLSIRSFKHIWHPCTQMKHHETSPLVPIEKAQGIWLYDTNGNRYMDAISSWWVNLFGHCHPYINDALVDQLNKIEHVMFAGFTHQPAVELAERLAQITPGNLDHCFFASDGASATEIALKMSFHYWQLYGKTDKVNFISLKNGYHGETLGSLSVTEIPFFRQTYAPLLRNTEYMPSPDWRNIIGNETHLEFALKAASELEIFLSKHHTQIAAFILEPIVQAAGGMGMYHPIYLQRARTICDKYEVHLIADEIAVGFGRTGKMFACEHAEIVPDLLCLAKGLTGGYLPLSVVMTTDKLYQAFYQDEISKAFVHSHSHTGNALACRASLAALDLIEQYNIIEANQAKIDYLNQLASPLQSHPKVKNFRNRGMIWAFEVETNDSKFSNNFFQKALEKQLLLRPLGKTVYFMPPYIIKEREIEHLVSNVLQIIDIQS
ncbi:MAG: adenosylmethionine--8-amino-7-oxononanoate transaminase [Nitrosomonas sp.]|nr:adenosylmethionine--8-amino-7-oxononanoate transaminase [Nitrosomonas sp.]